MALRARDETDGVALVEAALAWHGLEACQRAARGAFAFALRAAADAALRPHLVAENRELKGLFPRDVLANGAVVAAAVFRSAAPGDGDGDSGAVRERVVIVTPREPAQVDGTLARNLRFLWTYS